MSAAVATCQPFDVMPVVTRLREAVPALRQVGVSADFAAMTKLTDFAATVPSAYVLLARERAQETKSGISLPGQQTRLAQVVKVNFGVVLAVRNYRERAGAQLADSLDSLLGQVRAALMGWTPPGTGTRACQLGEGNLTQYDRATALWTDVWRTQHIIKTGASA